MAGQGTGQKEKIFDWDENNLSQYTFDILSQIQDLLFKYAPQKIFSGSRQSLIGWCTRQERKAMPVSVLAEPCSGLDVDVADDADDGFDTDAVVDAVAEDDVVPAEPPPPALPPLPPPGSEVRKNSLLSV